MKLQKYLLLALLPLSRNTPRRNGTPFQQNPVRIELGFLYPVGNVFEPRRQNYHQINNNYHFRLRASIRLLNLIIFKVYKKNITVHSKVK